MPRLIITPHAAQGMERCRQFLAQKNPLAMRRAAELIMQGFEIITAHPEIGRPYDDEPEMRELLIAFGESGYVALYRYDAVKDQVVILAFRHQKEAGY